MVYFHTFRSCHAAWICLPEKHAWLSAPSHMPLHSLIKSFNTTVNTGSEQAQFKPQLSMFISLGGWDPSPATVPCVRASNNMLSHMSFPMGVLELLQQHGRAAYPCPAQRVSQSCCKCKHAKLTVMEPLQSTDPHGTSSAAPSLSARLQPHSSGTQMY